MIDDLLTMSEIIQMVTDVRTKDASFIQKFAESLQHEVGGYIEAIYPCEDPVALVCNEEGKLEGLPLNRALRDEDGDIYSFLKLRNAAAAISEGGCVLSGSLH